jgi:D-alanine--poly(phosphoribitol) ligase subunit 1
MTFREKLIASLSEYHDRNAFCIDDNHYTYAALASRVSAIQRLLSSSFPGSERIGILISNTIDTYAAIVAIMLSGKTYIPIHPGHPPERIANIIAQADLDLILSGADEPVLTATTHINTAKLQSAGVDIFMQKGDISQDFVYILFTSGSTGVPKGTPLTYSNLESFINAFGQLGYQLTPDDRHLQMFDLTFDLSVMSYLVPLITGGCVYTLPDKGMKFTNVYRILEEYNITFALMVPSILTALRPYFHEIDLPAMRYSLFCGEALYTATANAWMQCVPNARIDNVYGPTEATIFCMTYTLPPDNGIQENNGIVCIGQPMAAMEAVIVATGGNEATSGEKGELCLYGPQVTPGYLDPEKSKSAFKELNDKIYYKTGDIAFRNADGIYFYCGRVDHQVKIQGFRIELSEVEHHARISANCNAVAIVTTNLQGMAQIELILEGENMSKAPLLEKLKTCLPSYMMPGEIHFLSVFPLNINGKTDRKEIEKLIAGTI